MTLSLLTILLWVLCALTKVAAAAMLVHQRAVRRWSMLFAWLMLASLRSGALMACKARGYEIAYFYIYYGSEPLDVMLTVGLFWQLLLSIPGYREFPALLHWITVALARGAAFVAVWLSLGSAGHGAFPWAMLALNLQRCLQLGWCAVGATVLVCVFVTRVGWPRDTTVIMVVMMALALLDTVTSLLLFWEPEQWSQIGNCEASTTAILFVYLTFELGRYSHKPLPTLHDALGELSHRKTPAVE